MYDLVVVGGGSGGLDVARAAARFGARVALIEKEHLGGECTYSACVPSKALIEAARRVHAFREAGAFGIKVGAAEVDFPAVMARVRAVVASFGGGDSGDSLRALGIDVLRGSAAFEAYDTVVIDGKTRVHGQRFVIATGSRAAVPEIPGLNEVSYLDNATLWDLSTRPESLVVVGAGPTGIEMAQAFARLGSQVTVLAETDHILPAEDPEVSDRLATLLAAEGVAIKTGVDVTRVSSRDGRKVCSYHVRAGGTAGEASGTHLLVATGRRPNIEELNLAAAGIHADPEHGIEVDDYLQTRSARIFAIGDVLHRHQFTHAAEREAAVVFQNAVLRMPKKIDYRALPWVMFTSPEIATVGLSESAARDQNPEVQVYRAEFSTLDRARIDGRTEGFAKVVATPSGKVLGATVIGAEASLILQEFVLAMEHGLTLADIAATTHAYPTYSGMARKLANQFVATRLEGGIVPSAVKWFLGYKPRHSSAGAAVETASHAEAAHHG